MTDFEKIKNYYNSFDEENRLSKDASGRLEYEMSFRILNKFICTNDNKTDKNCRTILDLGGGAGAYSFPLASVGHKVYLADLSLKHIEQAVSRKKRENATNLISCDVVNALDLSIYEDNQFDVIILFGPLYHLLEESERKQCLRECNRVLKTGGKIFASFIPHLSGSIAILDRYFWDPSQVDVNNLNKVFESGKFTNNNNVGFQEGYYPSLNEIIALFSECGFTKNAIKSIRGFGYEREEEIYKLPEDMKKEVFSLIDKTCEDKSIIEMCGHAMYIGEKNGR